MDSLFNCIRTKIRENILFSDKSISEAYKLLDKTKELLICLGDCVVTGNRVLAEHINREGKILCDLADEYRLS
ncbi:MAG: hypothetical protein ACE5KZ_11610 [Candidatus Scalinduaceae bacterium]